MTTGEDLLRAERALRDGAAAEADRIGREVLARHPGHPGATALRGAAMLALGQEAAALDLLRAATSVPGAPALWFDHLRDACQRNLLYDAAVDAARAGLRAAPDDTALLAALGSALAMAGDLTAARVILAESVRRRPEDVAARLAHAHALLAAGAWPEGWAAYEWRLRALARPLPPLPGPRWDGRALPDGVIALVSEQGFGDALHFARYVSLVAARCAAVAVACQPALIPLFRTLPGVVACVPKVSDLPPVAAHATFGSLPGLFETQVSNIPGGAFYLSADPARIAAWRARLGPGPLVGLVWAGNPANAVDRRRSLDLALLRPVLESGARLVSLQKETDAAGRALLDAAGVTRIEDGLTDFGETAAVAACLDLVISVDSAVAHLAGALGREVWLMLMEPADWRWLKRRQDTPWYPSARLIRQPRPGDWGKVIDQVAAALRARVRSRS